MAAVVKEARSTGLSRASRPEWKEAAKLALCGVLKTRRDIGSFLKKIAATPVVARHRDRESGRAAWGIRRAGAPRVLEIRASS